jgi:hypothetical protein
VEDHLLAPAYKLGKLVLQTNYKILAGTLSLPTQWRKIQDQTHYLNRADRAEINAVNAVGDKCAADLGALAGLGLTAAEGLLYGAHSMTELLFAGNGAPLEHGLQAFVLSNLASGVYEGVRHLRGRRSQTVSE